MIGYAVCYKDKDGFDILICQEGRAVILETEELAEQWLNSIKNKAYLEWRPEPEKAHIGMLWWKKEINKTPVLDPIKMSLGRQIYSTIFIKKVKVV